MYFYILQFSSESRRDRTARARVETALTSPRERGPKSRGRWRASRGIARLAYHARERPCAPTTRAKRKRRASARVFASNGAMRAARYRRARRRVDDRDSGRGRGVVALCAVVVALARVRTSGGEAIWGLETVYDGLGYNPEFPTQVCGPSKDGNSFRAAGCKPAITEKDSYGTVGDPGFSFARYAYKGKSYGPPYNNVADVAACTYSLTYAAAEAAGLEHCFYAPYTGGVPTTTVQKTTTNLGYSTLGWRLPLAEWRDKLPDYVVERYELPPLRLGFEEGTFWPNWKLLSSGLPNFAVTKTCFLEAHSGDYQLCSAYPTERREDIHGVLQVQSISFALGRGSLFFEANGGDKNVPDIPQDPYPIASHGKGALGVALTRISDGYRVLTKPVRARRYWETLRWEESLLAQYYGEVFRLEIFDYRSGSFGWLAVDSFVIPQAPVIITEVTPSIGPRVGGTRITISGQNFGSSVDDKTVFIGDKECIDLRMSYSRCSSDTTVCAGALSCTTPAGSGVGLTVAVVIGDPTVVRIAGPRGGFQAGFCGDESTEHPFSECAIDAIDAVAGARKRGFTYADPPTVTSTPVTSAIQDIQYEYTLIATDPDENDLLTYTAITLPTFLQFDPTTRLLTGVPLRSDVQCRSNNWHPASERCALGATYQVEFEISDSIYRVQHNFEVKVTTNETSLLVDKSFHWENALQIFEKYEAVVALGSVTESLKALENRNVTSPTEIVGFNYRNPLNDEDKTIRNALIAIAEKPNIDEVDVDAAIQWLQTNNSDAVNLDMIQALKEQVAVQKRGDVSSGASAPALQGVSWKGWLNYFKKLGTSLGAGSAVYTNVAGLPVPAGATKMLTREKIIVIKLSTPCNSTALNTDRYIPSCDAVVGMSSQHEVWLGFSDYGTTLEDVIVFPEDFEFADLVTSAVFTQDVPGFLGQLTRRMVAQSAKLQEIATLGETHLVWFDTSTSMLTVNMTIKSSPVKAVMQLATSYPYPEPGKYGLPEISVVSCDNVAYDYENALISFSNTMTRTGGSLTSRLAALANDVSTFASRCKNLCNGQGLCQDSQLPPVCQCYQDYFGDDCSQVKCPNDCSNNGACDSRQVCTHFPESGETDCSGGTGKCACNYPYFGKDCSLKTCAKNFIVFEGNSTHKLNVTAGTQPIKDKYTALGLDVYDVKISETNGDQPAAWAIQGDELSLAHLVGSAYVEFTSSEDGETARSLEPFYVDSIPSRGVAIEAQYFAQEYRTFVKREQQLLDLFGKSSSECNAAGACAFETGTCFCATQYYGAGCEFQYCANDCAGHGTCNKLTGVCTCETHYVTDETYGCALKDYSLISTTCTDEALDREVDDADLRVRPLHASCLFGTRLGSPVTGTTTTYITDLQGNVCLDCSGYTLESNSRIYFYEDEPCTSSAGNREDFCDNTKESYDTIVRGIGMIPAGDSGSTLSFNLAAMRTSDIQFSIFKAKAGIVREHLADIDAGGCGACTDDNPQCGAIFTIAVDGVTVWTSLVNNKYSEINIDISAASTMTLSTAKYTPPYWRSNVLPGLAGQDAPAVWCDGAAWADAEFY